MSVESPEFEPGDVTKKGLVVGEKGHPEDSGDSRNSGDSRIEGVRDSLTSTCIGLVN